MVWLAELLAPVLVPDGENVGPMVMISDDVNADGEFLLHHFLVAAAKAGDPICFLHFAQTFSHYNLVAQKLGGNLNLASEAGFLRAVDGLTLLGAEVETATNLTNKEKKGETWSRIADGATMPLLDVVAAEMDALPDTDRPGLVVVDDLSVLSFLGHSVRDVATLVFALRRLASRRRFSFVFLLHCDTENSNDDDETVSLIKMLSHRVDVHLAVRGLATGFCRDVHGSLVVNRKSVTKESGLEHLNVVERQFKLLDRDVAIFPPGLSAAVI